ncbi:MAG: DUF3494 domain-containing protein [Bacteroidetes bacterium]|nr:MAG: DUF3494 domain-containing protein [Bacteroidota bacterium]
MRLRKLFPFLIIPMVLFIASCDKNDDPSADRPQVTSTVPLSDAVDVNISVEITADFSKAMDPATINATSFTVKRGSTPVLGVVSYSGKTATFIPDNPLLLNSDYTATISTEAKDTDGNPLTAGVVWDFKTFSPHSPAVVNLMGSGNYVILAKTAITNNPTSSITGDLGLSPAATSYITGFALTNETGYASSSQVDGRIYAADMADPAPANLTTAVANMITAYDDAAGRTAPHFIELNTGNIGGKTLVPGLYKWTNTVTVPTSIILSGGADDVWIFQIAEDLTVSNNVAVVLVGGAKAKNIFWQVAGKATFGANSHFEGIVLSKTGISFQTGATFNGRALAQTSVILDQNTVVQPQ